MAQSDDFVDPFADGAPTQKSAAPVSGGDFIEPSPPTSDPSQSNKDAATLSGAKNNPWLSELARGMTFGLSDRAGSALSSIGDGNTYKHDLEQELAVRDALHREHPVGSLATNFAGGVLTGGPLAGIARSGMKAALPSVLEYLSSKGVAPALARIATASGTGTGIGAVNGAGQADYGETGAGAKQGSIIGLATGGGLSALGNATRGAYRLAAPVATSVGKAFGLLDPEKLADKTVMKGLAYDKSNPSEAAHELWDLSGQGMVDPMTGVSIKPTDARLLDIAGPSLGAQAKAALKKDTNAKVDLDELLTSRTQAQPERVAEAIRSSISPRTDGVAALDELRSKYKDLAAPYFEKARAMGEITDPSVADWFSQSPARTNMLREVVSSNEGHGTPMGMKLNSPDGPISFDQHPTVDDLLTVKNRLDQIRGSLWDPKLSQPRTDRTFTKMGGVDTDYGQASDNVQSYRDLLDKVTTDPATGESLSATGRKIAGEGFEVADALQQGQKITRMSEDQMKKAIANLSSDAEKEAFRTGAASSLYDISQKTANPTTRIAQLYGNPRIQKKLDLIFPDGDSQAYFSKMVGGIEKQLSHTAKEFSPGAYNSATDPDSVNYGLAQAGAGAATGSIRSVIQGVKNMANEAGRGNSDKYAESLIKRLMMNPAETEAFAKRVGEGTEGPLTKAVKLAQPYTDFLPFALGGTSAQESDISSPSQ